MWLELEPITHRCHVQLAAVRQIPQGLSTVLPCYCIAWHSHVLPWKLGATSLLVVCATVGWVGALYFFQVCHFLEVSEGRCFSQPAVLKAYTLEPHSVGRNPGGWRFPPVQAHRRRSLMDAVGQHAGAG